MNKKALHQDFRMELSRSRGRFLSILFIVAMGVAFFSGIRAAEPDMRLSGDAYFDKENLMDVQVIGTLGLTDKDVTAIKELKGVEKAEPANSVDALCDVEGDQRVVHVMSLPATMNKITLSSGRLPKEAGECVVDEDFLKNTTYKIGDMMQLSSGTDDPLTDSLKSASLKIVGAGSSPCYISIGRGNSTIGTGEIKGFVGVVPASFDMDVYTEIYVRTAGAKTEVSYTDAYEDKVEKTLKEVKGIADVRCGVRRDDIMAEAQEELDDAKETFAKKEKEVKDELAEAKKKLDDGEQKLKDARKQLADGKQAIADGKKKLDTKQNELDDGINQYNSGRKKLKKAWDDFQKKKKEFDAQAKDAKAQIAAGEQGIAAGQKSLEDLYKQYQAIISNPDATAEEQAAAPQMLAEWNKGTKELETKKQELKKAKDQLASGEAQIAAGRKELEKNEAKLQETQKQLESGQKQIDAARTELKSQEAKLSDGDKEIAKQARKLNDGKEKYADGEKEAEEKLTDARNDLKEAEDEIAKIEKPKWYVRDRSLLPEYDGYGENADRMRAIGHVFPVIFFLVAALISLTTMTRMVEEQRTQIGTLKALGYSRYSIAGKYLNYALLATLGGSVLGFLIGEKLFPYVIVYAYKIMYKHIPDILVPYHLSYGLMATAAAIGCTMAATYVACAKELRSTPAVLMRPPTPQNGKRVLIERIGFIWKHLSFIWKSTVRNLFRYKKRFFMTILGIGGCMALMVVGFGLRDSCFEIATLQYNELNLADGTAYLKDDLSLEDRQQFYDYLAQESQIDQTAEMYAKNVTIASGKTHKTVYMYVPKDVGHIDQFLIFRDRKSHEPYKLSDQGVILTEKMANTLKVSAGDKITIEDKNKGDKEVVVEHICENYMGHSLYMSPALYQSLYDRTPYYNSVLFSMKHYSLDGVQKLGEKMLTYDAVLNVMYTGSIQERLDDMLGSLNLVIVVLIISAGLLAFVVLYNLNNINITERKRELATIKLLGFYDPELAAYVYRENILLTLIGSLVGVVLGNILHRFIIVTVEIESAMFGRTIHWQSYLYSVLFTLAFSAFVNWLMYFKLKRINMVESLKSVE